MPSEKLAKHAARVQDLKQAKRHKEQALAAKHEAVAERNKAFEQLQGWLRQAQRPARTVKKEHAARQKSPMSIEL